MTLHDENCVTVSVGLPCSFSQVSAPSVRLIGQKFVDMFVNAEMCSDIWLYD